MLESQRSEKFDVVMISRFSILFFSVRLFYEYYVTTTLYVYHVQNPQFSLLSFNDSTDYVANDSYNELIDIKNFTFSLNPKPCQDYTQGLLLVIIVSSNPTNYENRMVIRNTWGRSVESTKVVFLVGDVKNEMVTQSVSNESAIFHDIVQGNFIDAYRNMTYKHVMGLKWVTHHCSMAKYVLKTDDDVLVNIRLLRHFLARQMSPWGAKGLIACQVSVNAVIQRTSSSKWMVTPTEFPGDYYPTYCQGYVILYSQDVVQRLLGFTQKAPYFWIDDVQVTGVAAESIGIARTNLVMLILNKRRPGPFLFGPPNLSTRKIIDIWKSIPE